jgi:hypothetical protein
MDVVMICANENATFELLENARRILRGTNLFWNGSRGRSSAFLLV